MLQTVPRRFDGFCIVAAPGPSLEKLTRYCVERPVLAIQDAWRLVPWAQVLYGCDARWWILHRGVPDFVGEKWSSHTNAETNDKRECHERFGLNIVYGEHGKGFSTRQDRINYGSNSGFQSINLAMLMGATRIALIGFDWQKVDGKSHFFGEHPAGFSEPAFRSFNAEMQYAADHLPAGVEVVNFTPGSALPCFPKRPPDDLPAFVEPRSAERVSADVAEGQTAASATA